MMTTELRQAIIKRLLARLSKAELEGAVPGFVFTGDAGAIDDGQRYGDTGRDERPDFVKRELEGWTPL